jgi:hypothetical protein
MLGADGADKVKLNQIQVIGSHNSYHIEPCPTVRGMIASTGERHAQGLEYTHPSLSEQFSSRGVRQIELDVFNDPQGGLYAKPRLRELLRASKKDPGPDPNEKGQLNRPGMKILHMPDVDFLTTVPTLIEALEQIRVWSQAHRRHVPILILLELKSGEETAIRRNPRHFGRVALETLEKEILTVFDRDQILKPLDVQGDSASLSEAVRNRGWPLLESCRGRVMFALDNEDEVRDRYLEMHATQAGQLLFVSVPESHPQAAWFKINDPIAEYERIRRAVSEGFMVRTRADAETRQARNNDTTQRDRALSSGAQFVSTDYPVPDPRFTNYCVQLPHHVAARSNPVSGRREWDGLDLEQLDQKRN